MLLTNEEIEAALSDIEFSDNDIVFARAIEAAILAKQAKAEPVAWRFVDDEEVGYVALSSSGPTQEKAEYLTKWNRPAWEPLFLHPPVAKPGWMPIETAPKDCGFLGYQRLTEDAWIISPMYWSGSEFLIIQFHSDNTEHSMNPTHWMPIAAAPGAEK